MTRRASASLSPVVTGDNDGTSTSLLALLDKVRALDALLDVDGGKLFCELIIADTTGVDHRVGRENVLI